MQMTNYPINFEYNARALNDESWFYSDGFAASEAEVKSSVESDRPEWSVIGVKLQDCEIASGRSDELERRFANEIAAGWVQVSARGNTDGIATAWHWRTSERERVNA
jgi:hypothetical protein